jgi:tRNA(fMet)-specific endonuclease VapC
MAYLLDTNVLSEAVRDADGGVAQRIRRALGTSQIVTSIIVAGELRFGGIKRRSRRLIRRIEQVLSAVDVLTLAPPVDVIYAQIRADLEKRGQPIGGNDLWIAAQALAMRHTLVTANAREFGLVPGLMCENWLSETLV